MAWYVDIWSALKNLQIAAKSAAWHQKLKLISLQLKAEHPLMCVHCPDKKWTPKYFKIFLWCILSDNKIDVVVCFSKIVCQFLLVCFAVRMSKVSEKIKNKFLKISIALFDEENVFSYTLVSHVCFCDLDFHQMTLKYEYDLDIFKIYLCTKNELFVRLSKVRAQTGQTHKRNQMH